MCVVADYSAPQGETYRSRFLHRQGKAVPTPVNVVLVLQRNSQLVPSRLKWKCTLRDVETLTPGEIGNRFTVHAHHHRIVVPPADLYTNGVACDPTSHHTASVSDAKEPIPANRFDAVRARSRAPWEQYASGIEGLMGQFRRGVENDGVVVDQSNQFKCQDLGGFAADSLQRSATTLASAVLGTIENSHHSRWYQSCWIRSQFLLVNASWHLPSRLVGTVRRCSHGPPRRLRSAPNKASAQYLQLIENFAGWAEQHWNEKEQSYDANGTGVTWARGNGDVCIVYAVLLTALPDRATISPRKFLVK